MKNFFKVILISIISIVCIPNSFSQGWEANYDGVMLQGFYWDSFDDTKWTNLTSQADEMSAYFDLIWVPNSGSSGYYSMGYNPQYWFQHESSFGTASELRNMINTFKKKGTGVIADVVINHRNGVYGWYDFPVETDHKGNTWELGLWAICGNDEMAWASDQPKPTGANDEGENFDGCRDLDHTNSYVQDAVKAYLDYLLNYLGYAGFRYDMTKGFAAYYVGLYNAAVNPKYSVGEYFDGNYDAVTGWIDGTIRDGNIQSGSFDFPLKFKMNEAMGYPSDFSKLAVNHNGANQPNGVIREPGFRRFSVTFVDNHDTYQRDNGQELNSYYAEAANAFILCHPGTPCVFLPHWKNYKTAIKRLIDVRKSVGIHNQSSVEVWEASTDKYVAKVYGTNGDLFIKVGYGDYTPNGFNDNDIVASGEGYCVWSKVSISSAEDKIVPENDRNGFSVYVKKSTVPASWDKLYCYAWDEAEARLTKVYPGEQVTKVVTVDGVEYYKYSFDAATTTANLLFANGEGSKTEDLTGITADTYYSFSSTNSSGYYTMTTLDVTGEETGEPITIYLDKTSVPASWGAVKYYAWDADDNKLLGAWSGTFITETVSLNGVDYYTYTFPENVTLVNVIFNDGSNQSVDVKGITETTFFALSDVLDGKCSVEELNVSDAQGIAVYLEKNSVTKAWGKVYYYAWETDGGVLTDYWPGTVVTQTVTVNGVEYYRYAFDSSVDELNLIFTNGTNQTADLSAITEDTYYTLLSADGEVAVVDPNDYTGEVEQAISIYLLKSSVSSWSNVYYYAWNTGGNLLAGWPGTNMKNTQTETVYGEEYYVYTFPDDVESLNIIFNNGSGQTADITNITRTTYFKMNNDFSYTKGNDQITIFLDKESASAWSKVKYYAWDNNEKPLLGAWSGTEMSKTMTALDGKEYYFYTFAPYYNPVNVIFNDGGSNQTVDLSATQSTFFRLNSTSGNKISASTVSTYIATGVEDVEVERTDCTIYPNPVTTDFVVRSGVEVDNVSVYDLNGALMQQVYGNVVDVRSLVSGFYLYKVVLVNGHIVHGKFVKR